jgi:hypothetical protein
MARKKAAAPITVYDRQAAAPDPSIVVFGQNEKGAPQGAWFSGVDAEVALKAAAMMGLRAATIGSEKHEALAKELQQGQVFASDRLFAPQIRPELYDQLFELCGATPVEDTTFDRPGSWDEIGVGSLVLATDGDQQGGWFEALVMATNDHLLQLRWRDQPRDASFIRARSEVALPPTQAKAA